MSREHADDKTLTPLVQRRDFMRMAGTIALGATMVGISPPADARQDEMGPPESAFRHIATLGLDIKNPCGMATSPDGRLFVSGEAAVAVLAGDGKALARHAIDGQSTCLALSADGKLFVGMRDHVLLLAPNDAATTVWTHLGERGYVTAIVADEQDVFVADAGNRVVLRFDRSGTLLRRIGERDEERDIPGLVVPSPYFDMALDPMGALWVANPGKHGLESYRPDGSLITSWYRPGIAPTEFCGCCNPIHIAFRSDHSLVTVEKGLNRVKAIAPDRTLRGLVAGPRYADGLPVDLVCKETPPIRGLAVDSKDRILILDARKGCVDIFEEQA